MKNIKHKSLDYWKYFLCEIWNLIADHKYFIHDALNGLGKCCCRGEVYGRCVIVKVIFFYLNSLNWWLCLIALLCSEITIKRILSSKVKEQLLIENILLCLWEFNTSHGISRVSVSNLFRFRCIKFQQICCW